jgi:ubiquinone/menaquinone biosynthesis C-methylase UbiE
MLEILKQKLDNKDNVEIVDGEVFEYQKKDIDLAFSCMAFHHIPDIEKTLNHLGNITNTGATIVIGDLRTEDGSFHRFEPIPHKGFDTEELSKQFQNAGFEVVINQTYHTLVRERTEGNVSNYEQFILIAKKK